MNTKCFISDQRGFTLVQAIFILVVLALLGAAMVRLLGGQSATSTLAVQQARAYQAAQSGLEWGTVRALNGNSCTGTFVIASFNVKVYCDSEASNEASLGSYVIFHITSEATYSSFGNVDFVSRKLERRIR